MLHNLEKQKYLCYDILKFEQNRRNLIMKNIKKCLLNTLACCAILVTTVSACGYCFFIAFQEELPEGAEKLIKG